MIDTVKTANTYPGALTLAKQETSLSLWNRYLQFCDRQQNRRFMWTALALILIPGLLMPLSFYVVFQYSWYTYVMMPYTFLLFANLVSNLVEMPMRISISIFFITILFNVLVPLVGVFV